MSNEHENWSYYTGKKNRNRVRVYERYPGSPLWIKWTDPEEGVKRESLRVIDDEPIYDKDHAVKVADRVSLRLKENHGMGSNLRELLGLPERYTLEELCDEIWEVEYEDWNEQYQKDQERYRDFWYEHLGRDTYLRSVPPAEVRKAANKAANARSWSAGTKRHYLVFIKSAYNFARDHLKWITSEHDLKSVDLPDTDPKQPAYEEEELFAVIRAAAAIDLRLHALALIALITLRRCGAILQTKASSLEDRVLFGERRTVLLFPGETDKSDNTAYAVLSQETARVLKELAARPAVEATDLLFVRGRLDDPDPPEHKRQPLANETILDWWHKAEALAEVPWVKDRGIHGIKRTVTTIAEDRLGSLSGAAHQSGTDEETLRKVYLRDNPGPKRQLADMLEAARQDWERTA